MSTGEAITTRVRAYYPFVRLTTATHARLDSRLAYGFVARPGVHETSVTRPDLFRAYLTEQIGLLIQNHGVPVEIGESAEPIPVHFAYRRDINIEAAISTSENSPVTRSLRDAFDVPDLATMDDAIADGTLRASAGRTRAAVAVSRRSRRLLAAPALSLHRHRSRAFPELRHLHQLPVLCRCLRADVPAAASVRRGRPRSLRRARQRDHAQVGGGTIGDAPDAHAADAGLPSGRCPAIAASP